ncbi:kinase-like domain-containing protein [Rhizophagus irregularis DAOM 181602=DAOM 197198]|nr:kinase-like domain-containing protein [Rhizophagus irregularis DAOM 181602=DAOM 197198]
MANNLWKEIDFDNYQYHVTISSINLEETIENKKIVKIEDLEKRKDAYGTCGECNSPGTGSKWCRTCNAKRFKENFSNWTSEHKEIDELIRESQINAVYHKKCLEWIPFEDFEGVTPKAKGGFGEIYEAKWPKGYICYWDIENKEWNRRSNIKVALKKLDDFFDRITEFLNEIKSHLDIYLTDVIQCYGITKNKDSGKYMMVLQFCENGNLREYLNKSENYLDYESKIEHLYMIARGLSDIHNAGKVHRDIHPGNILFWSASYISDLGMCQREKDGKQNEIFGALRYMAPEVLRGNKYTKAADIYSFGIVMHEFISEEIPYNKATHDNKIIQDNKLLALSICDNGVRPEISEDIPKLLVDLITKCWDGKAENRPTAKELCQKLKKLDDEIKNHEDEDNEDSDNNERNKDNKDPEAYISKSLSVISDCLSCKI